MNDLNTIAIFKWTGELPSDAEVGADPATRYSSDFGEQWAYQAALPVATALLQAVRNYGLATETERPHFDEFGWHFNVEIQNQSYSVVVSWILPKDERNDCFAVQPSLNRSCLANLFLPRPPETSLRAICEVLQQAMAGHSRIAELEWVRSL